MTLPVQDVFVTLVALGCALTVVRRVVGTIHRADPKCASCGHCAAKPPDASRSPQLITIRGRSAR